MPPGYDPIEILAKLDQLRGRVIKELSNIMDARAGAKIYGPQRTDEMVRSAEQELTAIQSQIDYWVDRLQLHVKIPPDHVFSAEDKVLTRGHHD